MDPVDPLSLDEALSIVGEETRAQIIVELGEATQDDGVTPTALSFSELRERVGAADSGRFNYHLGKLVDAFVKKCTRGYLLRPPGQYVYRAIVSGTLTERASFEPFVVDDCPECGDDLVAEYPANHCIYVRCPGCETYSHAMHLPNSGFADRSPADALEAALRKNYHDNSLLRQGVCNGCSATVSRRLRTKDYEPWDELFDFEVYAVLSCSTCNGGSVGHPANLALTTPAVASFFADHDREVAAVPPWAEAVVAARDTTTVTDDGTCAIEYELDDERLSVRLDDDLRIADHGREHRQSVDA